MCTCKCIEILFSTSVSQFHKQCKHLRVKPVHVYLGHQGVEKSSSMVLIHQHALFVWYLKKKKQVEEF